MTLRVVGTVWDDDERDAFETPRVTLIRFGEASIFAVSSFVGSALSIVPAGLGVRELVVATLSPLIALPPAVGFLSVAVNRTVDMVGLAAISAALFICKRDTPRWHPPTGLGPD